MEIHYSSLDIIKTQDVCFLFADETHLPAQILIVHVPNKQRFGGKCIGLNIYICSCHLEEDKNDAFTVTRAHITISPKQSKHGTHTLSRLILVKHNSAQFSAT